MARYEDYRDDLIAAGVPGPTAAAAAQLIASGRTDLSVREQELLNYALARLTKTQSL